MVPRLQVVRGTRWARGGDRRDGSGMIRRKLLRNMPGKQSEGSGPLLRSESVRRVQSETCRGSSRGRLTGAPGRPRAETGGADPA